MVQSVPVRQQVWGVGGARAERPLPVHMVGLKSMGSQGRSSSADRHGTVWKRDKNQVSVCLWGPRRLHSRVSPGG